jgi:hypothetical protein
MSPDGDDAIEKEKIPMKKMFQAVVVAAAVLAVPGLSLAAQTTPAAKPAKATKTAAPATKTAHGVVKSMDATSLVVTPKGGKDLTFALDNSTQKEGNPAVGSTVTVKYKAEGTTMTATDVKAEAPKAAKPAKAAKTEAAKK